MKILVVSSFLPYPLRSGGHVRLFNILKGLSKNHAITLVCEKRAYQTLSDEEEVKKICKEVITVQRKKQWSLSNIVKTGFGLYPFLIVGHSSDEFKRAIKTALEKDRYDLIHAETFYIFQNIPKTSIPTILVEHNIEYKVYGRYLRHTPFVLRPFLWIDVQKLIFWEKYFWKKATCLVSVSEEEKKEMVPLRVEIVPNGVDTTKFTVHPFGELRAGSSQPVDLKKERRILFIGDLKWVQNRDTLKWVLKEIWPSFVRLWRTSEGKPTLKLWVVSREIPEYIKRLTTDESVIFDEDAPDDASQIFEKADILLAPIRIGGGTSYKILEAMASGVAVITTSLGAAGLHLKHREHVLIGETSNEIVRNLQDILIDKDLYTLISQNARKLIEEKYDWNIIVKKLENVYKLAVDIKY